MKTHHIITEYDCKVIPDRGYDWIATLDGYQEGDVLGYGKTEIESIKYLLDKLEEAEKTEEEEYMICVYYIKGWLPYEWMAERDGNDNARAIGCGINEIQAIEDLSKRLKHVESTGEYIKKEVHVWAEHSNKTQ